MKILGISVGIENEINTQDPDSTSESGTDIDVTEIKCSACGKFKKIKEYFPSIKTRCRQCLAEYKEKKKKLITENNLSPYIRILRNIKRKEKEKNIKLGKSIKKKKKKKYQWDLKSVKQIIDDHLHKYKAAEGAKKHRIHSLNNVVLTRKNPMKRLTTDNYIVVLKRDAYNFDLNTMREHQIKRIKRSANKPGNNSNNNNDNDGGNDNDDNNNDSSMES